MKRSTEGPDADAALVAQSLSQLAAVSLPPPKTDAAALLRRWRFLERARARSRSDERAARPLAAGYALAAALLVTATALPALASLGAASDAETAVVASLVRLLAWPAALVGGGLLLAAGLLWPDS